MKHIPQLFFCFISALSFGQKDVVASGGDATGAGGSVSYSVSQVAYQSLEGSSGILTQGVQQPFEIFALSAPEFDDSFSVMLYPNPTSTSVILSLDVSKFGLDKEYKLTDSNGRVVFTGKITSDETVIDVRHYPSACYYVSIINGNKRVKTFKLIKNDQ